MENGEIGEEKRLGETIVVFASVQSFHPLSPYMYNTCLHTYLLSFAHQFDHVKLHVLSLKKVGYVLRKDSLRDFGDSTVRPKLDNTSELTEVLGVAALHQIGPLEFCCIV